jgi:uncharacterized Zn finger protein (UPF0148 family)
MMDISRLERKCPRCNVTLFRVVAPATDEVFCLECGAGADHEQFLEKGADLIEGRVPQEQLLAIRRRLWAGRD